MRTSTGATTMATLPIQRRTHMTSETTPRIPSRLHMITLHTLSQRDTRHMVKNTNRITHPLATIPTQRHMDNPRHQITTKHTLRLLILLTRSLRRHRSPFSPNRSSSTWVSRQSSPTALPTSVSLPHPHRAIKPPQPHFSRMRITMTVSEMRATYPFCGLPPPVPRSLSPCACPASTTHPQMKMQATTISAMVGSHNASPAGTRPSNA
jgi:hypothetical protein